MIQVTLIVGAAACLLLGLTVVWRNKHNLANLLAASIIFCLAVWQLAILGFMLAGSEVWASVFAKLYYIVAAVALALLAIFAFSIPDERIPSRRVLATVSTLCAVISGLVAFMPGFIISKVIIAPSGNHIQANIVTYVLYGAYFIGFLLASVAVIFRKFIQADEKFKIQLGAYLAALLSLATPGILADVLLPKTQNDVFVWTGLAAVLIAAILISYIIMKSNMVDVRFAAVRTIAYVLSLAFLIVFYYLLATIVSGLFLADNKYIDQSTLSMLFAFGLIAIYQPTKRFFDDLTKNIFYRDGYDSDEFFARLNKALTSTTDLRNLLERASYEIASTLKSDQAFFYIEMPDGRYMVAGTDHHSQLPKSDAQELKKLDSNKHRVIVASKLRDDDHMRRLMRSHRIELALPLTQSQAKISGCLCLGGHLTTRYTNRDLRTLETIADELLIAIQNTLSIQEVKEVNETLQQRVANATRELRSTNLTLRHLDESKDEFISMASHQLRTPLTSIKGYISMILEGDAGEVNDMQRQFLKEAFMSSERMVRLIGDFLNVSRLQTGKFVIEKHPVDLAKVVAQEIEGLQPSAVSRNMTFVYDKPQGFPTIDLDEDKMRQVIMNFADNAIYYSHDGSSIEINLSLEGDEAVFTVKDNGIGVPPHEQAKLFGKFFRASNARQHRPDGTGVGLFLAKKVIDAHGGQIIFHSQVGKGSTFGFRMPLTKVK